jgi:hypothetical protein
MKIPLLNFEMEKNPQFEEYCFIKKGRCLNGCKKLWNFVLLNEFYGGFLEWKFSIECFVNFPVY